MKDRPFGTSGTPGWLNRYEPLLLVMFAALSGGILLFIYLTGEVLEGSTKGFDEAILLALRQPANLFVPIGPGWLTHAVRDITSLGGTTVLALMTALVTISRCSCHSRLVGASPGLCSPKATPCTRAMLSTRT